MQAPSPETKITGSSVRNDLFDSKKGLERGRSKLFEALWYVAKRVFFKSVIPWPNGLKRSLLAFFGAKVGKGVVIKPQVNILFPWKLEIGDHTWIGEEVLILNFEKCTIGANCCISQRVFLCGGNHNFRDPAFSYRNGPITVSDGAWIGAQAFVGPNIEIGVDTVVAAGSVATKSLPAGRVCVGNPCVPTGYRWRETGAPFPTGTPFPK